MIAYGEWSEEEVRVLRQLIEKDSVIVEAGANIGTHTVPLAKTVGEIGTVIAFEPQTEFFQTLCANVSLNGLSNVDCRNAAVGETSGMIHVPASDFSRAENHSGRSLSETGGEYTVPISSIDDLNLEQLHLIKADVQGFESAVIRGAYQTINRLKPQLYLENEEQSKSPELIRQLWEMGYDIYWHLPFVYSAQNHFRNPKNLFPEILSCNILAVHQDQQANLHGFRKVTNAEEWLLPRR